MKASAREVRECHKQFAEAKLLEWKSWVDNEVFLSRWSEGDQTEERRDQTMGTHQRDRQGNFLRAKARWVLRGFQDKQKDYLQTDSPASTRPGFRMGCQVASSKNWDLFHIDLKTAFLQGQSCDVNRDVVCQLLPEANHPLYLAARLKKPAYGMNDASRLGWNILDKALRSYGMVPTRADRCCYVLYSLQSRRQAWERWVQGAIAQQNGAKDAFTESGERSEMEAAFVKKTRSHS